MAQPNSSNSNLGKGSKKKRDPGKSGERFGQVGEVQGRERGRGRRIDHRNIETAPSCGTGSRQRKPHTRIFGQTTLCFVAAESPSATKLLFLLFLILSRQGKGGVSTAGIFFPLHQVERPRVSCSAYARFFFIRRYLCPPPSGAFVTCIIFQQQTTFFSRRL